MERYVEELGSDIVEEMPGLIDLQNTVISLPSINSFIKSNKYYPLGDRAYVDQVITTIRQRFGPLLLISAFLLFSFKILQVNTVLARVV